MMVMENKLEKERYYNNNNDILSAQDDIAIDKYKEYIKRKSTIPQPSTVSIGRQQLVRHRTELNLRIYIYIYMVT